MADKQAPQRYIDRQRKIPGWLWRLVLSLGLGCTALATAVPWAQAQRGYPRLGGEYLLVLATAVLPLVIFRR